MLGWHVLTFCVFGIVHWREAYERIFWWEGPKDSGQRTPRVVGSTFLKSCNLNQWRRSWEKWLQSETIEQRRTRCPILSNSVMTGWQGNRWLARSPRFCRTKSPKKRFLEDRTAPAANVNKGGRDALPAKRKTIFSENDCYAKTAVWGDLRGAGVHICLTNSLFLPAKYLYRLLFGIFSSLPSALSYILRRLSSTRVSW